MSLFGYQSSDANSDRCAVQSESLAQVLDFRPRYFGVELLVLDGLRCHEDLRCLDANRFQVAFDVLAVHDNGISTPVNQLHEWERQPMEQRARMLPQASPQNERLS